MCAQLNELAGTGEDISLQRADSLVVVFDTTGQLAANAVQVGDEGREASVQVFSQYPNFFGVFRERQEMTPREALAFVYELSALLNDND